MEYEEFWAEPDESQAQLAKYIIAVFFELQDEIQAILSRFPTFDGELTKRELEWLYRTIDKHESLGYYGNNLLELYIQDLSRRIHIQRDYAFDVLVAAAFMKYYVQIFEQSKIMYSAIFKNKYKWFTGENYGKEVPANIYTGSLPSGVSPKIMVDAEAEYRAGQIRKAIKAQRINNENFSNINTKSINIEFERAENALLKKSKGNGYHGVMDRIMTSVVGYAAMAALEATDAETYTFYNPLDERTTGICRYLSGYSDYGKKYPVSKAKYGYNVPPIYMDIRYSPPQPFPHNCRSWISIP